MEPSPEDYPEPLQWERPLWNWYERLCRQWRIGPMGPVGLDYSVWLPVIEREGWSLGTSLDLLSRIESAQFAKEEKHVTRH